MDGTKSAQSQLRPQAFVQPTASLGREEYFEWDKALGVAEAMDDQELSRKMLAWK